MSENKTDRAPSANPSRSLIYVVDDEPMLLELAAVILEPTGCRIQCFRDPGQALEAFAGASPRPDLLITDFAMHGLNGMQLVEKFRRLNPGQKILLISGTVGVDVFRDAAEKPDRFLAKPYQAHQLTAVVNTLLAGR